MNNSDKVSTINQLISDALYRAKKTIQSNQKQIDNLDKEYGWCQFLNSDKDEPSTSMATAYAILTLINCGIEKQDIYLLKAKDYLLNNYCEIDNGWTKNSLKEYYSISLDTSIVLYALLEVGIDPENLCIRNAITWILKAQNLDGGWGIVSCTNDKIPDNKSNIICTSLCIQSLSKYPLKNKDIGKSINKGAEWILSNKKEDENGIYWSDSQNTRKISYTYYGVEGLYFSEKFESKHANKILSSIHNEVEELNNDFSDRFPLKYPKEQADILWTFLPQESLFLLLLRISEFHFEDFYSKANEILKNQSDFGYWTKDKSYIPIWRTKWAVKCLSVFQKKILSDKNFVYEDRVKTLESQVQNLILNMEKVNMEIKQKQNNLSWIFSMIMNKTKKNVLNNIGYLIAAFIFMLGVFLYWADFIPPAKITIFSATFGIFSFGIAIYNLLKNLNKNNQNEK